MYSRLYVLIQKNCLLNNKVSVIGVFNEKDVYQKKNQLVGLNSNNIYEVHGPFNVDRMLDPIPEYPKPKILEIFNPFKPIINPKPNCPSSVIDLNTDSPFKRPNCPGPNLNDSDSD